MYYTFGGEEGIIETTNVIGEKFGKEVVNKVINTKVGKTVLNTGEAVFDKVINTEVGKTVLDTGEKIGEAVFDKVINTEVGNTLLDTSKKINEQVFDKVIDTPIFYNVIRQIFKYLIQGFVVAIAGYYIPAKKPEWNEILMISLVAASTFAILEIYMPDAYLAARFGFGFTTGSNLIPKFLM